MSTPVPTSPPSSPLLSLGHLTHGTQDPTPSGAIPVPGSLSSLPRDHGCNIGRPLTNKIFELFPRDTSPTSGEKVTGSVYRRGDHRPYVLPILPLPLRVCRLPTQGDCGRRDTHTFLHHAQQYPLTVTGFFTVDLEDSDRHFLGGLLLPPTSNLGLRTGEPVTVSRVVQL